jgi:hypothetical protein
MNDVIGDCFDGVVPHHDVDEVEGEQEYVGDEWGYDECDK